jgi:hypothetical protein
MVRTLPSRDVKGRFVKAVLSPAPSYICQAIGMDRIGPDAVAVLVAAPIRQPAPCHWRVPSGAWASFAIWLVVMLAACGYAVHL